jgi:protein SCO1/2
MSAKPPRAKSSALHPAVYAVAGVLALGAGASAWLVFGARGDRLAECREGGALVGANVGGPFELTRADGVRVTDRDVIDRPTLLYFGYTHCPDFCPADATNMGLAADLLAERGVAVNTVFITIDPARDTPEVVGYFTDAMHPDMIGLTGSDEDIAAAARAWRVYYAKSGADPDYYLMDHSTFTYLAAPGRGFLDFFRHGTPPAEIADRVACYAKALG